NYCMIVDLSVALNQNTPVYPGDPKISIKQSADIASSGYLHHSLELGTHTGTHIDAPAHMLEGAQTMGHLPLEVFAGAGKVVQGTTKEAIKDAGVAAGDIILFDTGTSERFYETSYFTDYPVLSDDVVDYLIEKKVKLVGLDTCSADITADFPIHKKLLSAGIPIVENLTNLSALQDTSFLFYALPLKLDLDGAPTRAFAVVHDA
ncbi:MAG TPA: cyclase family protein, partial [Candidatus Limnocylindrales bacterium]|nr:cyclase family protein [Candidatus Limnocylindrales bacterium]